MSTFAAEAEVTTPPPAPDAGGRTPGGGPVTVIGRQPGWRLVNLRELWRYRELLFFLTWRDIKVRYKQAVLGAAWAVLQPLATMVVFSIFFSRLAGLEGFEVPYPLFVFCGLVPWIFFANAISSSSQSLISNQNLVTKVYFPRLLIPMGAVGAGLVDLTISSGILVILMVFYGVPPTWSMLLMPVMVAGLVMAALGVGTLLAALTVAYRDFRYVLSFLVQLWMFATPTIYMVTRHLGPRWEKILPLNPAYGLIRNFRAAALGWPLLPYDLLVSTTVAALLLLLACLYFRRVERSFADII